jgi:TatD DNase family protein
MYFDTHAHYDDERFDNDRDKLLINLNKNGVEYIVNPAIDIKTSKFIINLSKKHNFIYTAVGIHPHEATTEKDSYIELNNLLKEDKVVAIGEIGLDYHYNFQEKNIQKDCFIKQLRIARESDLPVIIHDREAHGDIMEILHMNEFVGLKGIMHCFSGSKEMARELIKMGFYLSFGGAITFKNAKKSIEVIKEIPNDRILIETDSPYLTPVPNRGKRNDSSMLKYVVQKISEIKEIDVEKVCELTKNNAIKFFNISLK